MTKPLQTDTLEKNKNHPKREKAFLQGGEVHLRKIFMGQKERKDKNQNTHLMEVIQMEIHSDPRLKQKEVALKIVGYQDQEM